MPDYEALQREDNEAFFRRSRTEWAELGGFPFEEESDERVEEIAAAIRGLEWRSEELAWEEREAWLQREFESDLRRK